MYPTNGSSATLTADYKGITYTITYKIRKTISGVNYDATDSVVVRINE